MGVWLWGGVWGGRSIPTSPRLRPSTETRQDPPPQTPPNNLAIMPEKTQGFTEDQVEDFKEGFQLFDTKGDGLIQVTQVGEVLRALGQNPTEGDVKKLVQSTNSKGGPDARVTFDTFLPLLQAVSGKKITDTVDDFVEGLRHFDKEGNGRISAIELRHLLTGLGEKMSEEEVEQLIHGKEDSQGNIDYEELVKKKILEEGENYARGTSGEVFAQASTLATPH